MGCNTSKLDDEEAVQMCKDRKKFMKQALEHRTKFASGHIAYIQSLKRVSVALREYIEGDDRQEFSLDSLITPPFTPVKKLKPEFVTISPKCFSMSSLRSKEHSSVKINYYRPSGTPSICVEERPQSPDTYHVESYSPMAQYGFDGFFSTESPQMNSSYYSSTLYDGPSIPPPSPQKSQWDFFWDPFSSLDYYGYPTRSSLGMSTANDDLSGIQQVREEEGIPDLEKETVCEEIGVGSHRRDERVQTNMNDAKEQVLVQDVDQDVGEETVVNETVESSEVPKAAEVEVNHHETVVTEGEKNEEGTPGFTVYVDNRPTSMDEVIKDLESQFEIVCNAANDVSALLEAKMAQCLTPSKEVTAIKMLNPVALFRSASSRSSPSKLIVTTSSGLRDEDYESTSDLSDDSSVFSSSHHSTLDKLYTWEKRLYDEVRSGARIRLAYEKKCAQLRDQDVKGHDPSTIEKVRMALRDLHSRIKVSVNSIASISKRIETLRDQELQPQVLELVQGLARMWKTMAESHQIQKQKLDEAKLLLTTTPTKLNISKQPYDPAFSGTGPHQLARSAANLEAELRKWRSCFALWITSQRSYIHAVSNWLLRCTRCEPNTSTLSFSPRHSSGVHPVFGICIQWARLLDSVAETPVVDGMNFFAAGMGSINAQAQRLAHIQALASESQGFEDSHQTMGVVGIGQVEEVMTPEKIAEVAVRVLCAGMSVTMSSLTEFSTSSAEGYAELLSQWEKDKWPPSSVIEGT